MNTQVEQVRQRIQHEIAALRQLEQQPLNPSRTETFGIAPLPLLVVAGADPRHPDRCFLSLGAGGNVPVIARDLPCGILAADGRLMAARRTDRNGSFWVQSAEREFRLRFVNEVRTGIDVDILLSLDDDAAYAQLDAALENPDLSEMLRERIGQTLQERTMPEAISEPVSEPPAHVLEIAGIFEMFRRANAGREDDIQPIAAPALRTLDDAKYDAWRCEAVANGTLGAHVAVDGPRPPLRSDWGDESESLSVEESRSESRTESRDEWVAIRGDRIRVRAPAELVPYGVVRILAKEQDLLVGTCLLPLIKYQTVRSNLWPLARVVGERDLRTVRWYAQPATDETLAWFSADEVAELLNRSDVRDYEELRKRVERLLELVQQREQEMADG